MIKKIKYWFQYKGRYLHKDFIQGIKNLIKWFPVIWKDRNYDHDFIFILLEQKLINQSKYIHKKSRHLNANRDAERIMTCVRLIQKVREEYYHMEYMDYHKSEYHWDEIIDKPDYKQLRVEEISENFDDYFKKYPLVFKKIKSKYVRGSRSEKNNIAVQMSWENHKRAKRLLFKMLNEHIESWWD